MVLVIRGELLKHAHEDAMMEVHLLTEENGGVPEKYAGGDALTGQLELLVAARLPSRCSSMHVLAAGLNDLGLVVRDANLSLDSGVAHNAFHVVLKHQEGETRPAADRAAELQTKIQALQASMLRPGDAMRVVGDDGSSRIPRLGRTPSIESQPTFFRQRSLSNRHSSTMGGGGLASLQVRAAQATSTSTSTSTHAHAHSHTHTHTHTPIPPPPPPDRLLTPAGRGAGEVGAALSPRRPPRAARAWLLPRRDGDGEPAAVQELRRTAAQPICGQQRERERRRQRQRHAARRRRGRRRRRLGGGRPEAIRIAAGGGRQ